MSEIRYDSVYDIAWNYITKFVYFKIYLYNNISSAHQYFFNKRKLVTKKRMELLKIMMDDQLDRGHEGIDTLDLMTKLYSLNWVLPPSGKEHENKLELYLESLVESGEFLVSVEIIVKVKGEQ